MEPIVIISYRQEWERMSRSKHGEPGKNSSDLESRNVNSIEDAATYIAGRINEHPEALYVHYIFDNWIDAQYLNLRSNSARPNETSVFVARSLSRSFTSKKDYWKEEGRKALMQAEIERIVKGKLIKK